MAKAHMQIGTLADRCLCCTTHIALTTPGCLALSRHSMPVQKLSESVLPTHRRLSLCQPDVKYGLIGGFSDKLRSKAASAAGATATHSNVKNCRITNESCPKSFTACCGAHFVCFRGVMEALIIDHRMAPKTGSNVLPQGWDGNQTQMKVAVQCRLVCHAACFAAQLLHEPTHF